MCEMEHLTAPPRYDEVLGRIVGLLEAARRASARSVNTIMTATYWEIGRYIVEGEQGGSRRADYGEALISALSTDLTSRFGRGYSTRNLASMRLFFLKWPILQTPSAQSPSNEAIAAPTGPVRSAKAAKKPVGRIRQSTFAQSVSSFAETAYVGSNEILQTPSAKSSILPRFHLPWSHYVKLLAIEDAEARSFYETEALRGGWSVRQLSRQIETKFYERTLLSRNKAAMLRKGEKALPDDAVSPEEEIKDPFVLEFLGLKDEYSETELEEALIKHLEAFLLELGGDFTFVGRQRRLRIGNKWYRIDLLFFHRRLRCLVVIDLKLGTLSHADGGQMHMYLNYACEHWTHEHENPPVGLILCAERRSRRPLCAGESAQQSAGRGIQDGLAR